MGPIEIPVLVVGGGGCGLVSSIMLSNLGVKHVLVESHPTTAHLPKASLLNQRTAEILDQHGVWDKILEIGCPPEEMKYYHYVTSLGKDGLNEGFELGKVPCYGCNKDPGLEQDYIRYRKDSAYTHSNLPLIRLEPLLRKEAELRNPGNILFNHKLVSFQENQEHVVVDVINLSTGEKITYLAQYVIAADGGKTIPPALGIRYEGLKGLADTTSVHFKADLSKYWQDGALMNWIVGLQGQEGTLSSASSLFGADWSACIVTGPTWGKHSEEWVFHLGMGQEHLPMELLSQDKLKLIIRRTLNIPDLDPEILTVSRWQIDGIYASQYQTRRIFLAGDAAHRHPPITGLGLNTAIGDAHNLTWKLAAVLKTQASKSLLLTYQPERQAVGKRIVEWALFSFMNIRVLDSATGFIPGGKQAININRGILTRLTSDTFDGAARRAAFRHAVQSQRVETAAHDLELGSIYPTGLFVSDGSLPPDVDPRGHLYVPTARPGHRLPHAWLQGSKRISTHHLIDKEGSWALVTDTSIAAERWLREAAKFEERTGITINVTRIGKGGDFLDDIGQWAEDSGLKPSSGGAVLVRPDTYVAFRSTSICDETVAQFHQVQKMLVEDEKTHTETF